MSSRDTARRALSVEILNTTVHLPQGKVGRFAVVQG